MGKKHQMAERRQLIKAAIEGAGQLSVAELSATFDVSEVTIRNDLEALSQQGLVLRTRGGAISTNAQPEFSFDVRLQQWATEKAHIGRVAAGLVESGDTIFLDASTTAHATVLFVKRFTELTVITNGLKTAMALLDTPHIQVVMPGGNLRRESISLVGHFKGDLLEDINIAVGLFGARGVTVQEGLTDVNLQEVILKRAVVERCQRVVGLVDARKWGQVAAATFADLSQVDTLITDNEAPDDLVRQIRQHGVEVILA